MDLVWDLGSSLLSEFICVVIEAGINGPNKTWQYTLQLSGVVGIVVDREEKKCESLHLTVL